jgi:predicted phosphodiesterase
MTKEKLETLVEKYNLTAPELDALVSRIKNQEIVNQKHNHNWSSVHTKIGVCSDLHIGSKYVNFFALNDLFLRFKKERVDAVYIAGDITEGYNRRKGQAFECDLHGADAQVKGVIESVPMINKPIYYILGDHDGWHYESSGVDIGKMIEKERKDMHYLGLFNATINLSKNTSLRLVHPAKGTAYAISYQIQKMIEAFTGGEKPNLLAVGHYHKAEYLFYRNVHAWQTGCIQAQTPWMQRMNLSAHVGGWIIDVYMKKNGHPDKVKMEFYPY